MWQWAQFNEGDIKMMIQISCFNLKDFFGDSELKKNEMSLMIHLSFVRLAVSVHTFSLLFHVRTTTTLYFLLFTTRNVHFQHKTFETIQCCSWTSSLFFLKGFRTLQHARDNSLWFSWVSAGNFLIYVSVGVQFGSKKSFVSSGI